MFEGLIGLNPDADVEIAPATLELPVTDPKSALSIEKATVPELLNAQATTVQWIADLRAEEERALKLDAQQVAQVQKAFTAVADPYRDPHTTKTELMLVNTPPAVRHLAGMLSGYDWEFVHEAKKIRGFIVARLLEHAKSGDAKVSLQALRTLGTVTEVGAYTERVEVAHTITDTTREAVVERLRARLHGMLPQSRAQREAAAAEVAEAVVINDRAQPGILHAPGPLAVEPPTPPTPPSS